MLRSAAALFIAALLAPAMAPAKIYYVNQGVKYHLGDGHAVASHDALFLDAYPVVGPRWVQAFTVDREDTVRVRVDHIWGVDDCAYCKDMIFIDDRPMARLYEENNHAGFATPPQLSMHVVPGHVYTLRIESEGSPGPIDDFAVEGVAVESDTAEVQMLQPGPVILQAQQPMPEFHAPAPVVGPCEGTKDAGDWMPPAARSRGTLAWDPTLDPVLWRLSAPLDAGSFARVFLKVDSASQGGMVDQFFEVLLGDAGTGWVLDFAPGQTKPFMGNVKVGGRYRSDHFQVTDWNQGGWNELQVARCPDGQGRFWVNGKDVGVPLAVSDGSAFRVRSGGLKAEVAEKPY